MKKLGQAGFTLIEGLLIVIAISLVVGVGYYIYNTNQKTDKSYATTEKSYKKFDTKQATVKKYLEIKELGIKFELNDKLKQAYYAKINGYYYFSVHDFDSNPKLKDCAAGQTTDQLGIVALVTGKVGEDNGTPGGGIWTQAELDKSGMKKVDDTYYGFMRGNAYCFDPSLADADELDAQIKSFIDAYHDQTATFSKI